MLKKIMAHGRTGPVVIVDSITQLTPDDAGAIVLSGSHGGVSSGEVAVQLALAAVFFNDAGVGKDGAGIAALAMLQALGTPAGTVAHTSGRIGDAQDMWEHGVISHVNEAARSIDVLPGASAKAALRALADRDS